MSETARSVERNAAPVIQVLQTISDGTSRFWTGLLTDIGLGSEHVLAVSFTPNRHDRSFLDPNAYDRL